MTDAEKLVQLFTDHPGADGCGRVLGHGEYCCEGHYCGSCDRGIEARELAARVAEELTWLESVNATLRAWVEELEEESDELVRTRLQANRARI